MKTLLITFAVACSVVALATVGLVIAAGIVEARTRRREQQYFADREQRPVYRSKNGHGGAA